MSENQKNESKKSFLQRNLFLIIIFLIIITIGVGYLYRNNLLLLDIPQFSESKQETQTPVIEKDTLSVNDLNNKELEDKVDRLESLILELAQNVQNIPQPTIVQPEPEPQQITLSNDEAYELILSINQIIINVHHLADQIVSGVLVTHALMAPVIQNMLHQQMFLRVKVII